MMWKIEVTKSDQNNPLLLQCRKQCLQQWGLPHGNEDAVLSPVHAICT